MCAYRCRKRYGSTLADLIVRVLQCVCCSVRVAVYVLQYASVSVCLCVYVCVPLTQAIQLNVDQLNHTCVAVCVLQHARCNVRVAVCVKVLCTCAYR